MVLKKQNHKKSERGVRKIHTKNSHGFLINFLGVFASGFILSSISGVFIFIGSFCSLFIHFNIAFMSNLMISKSLVAFASSALLILTVRKALNDKSKLAPQSKSKTASTSTTAENKETGKYKGVFVELILPISELGRAEVLLNNDTILTRAVRDAKESIYVYILEESPECVINSSEIFHYMSDVYSQLWDEMVSQHKLFLSCAVVCDAVEVPFSSPAGLYSQPCVEALYTTNLSPVRSRAINSIRASAGIEEPLVFEECAPTLLTSTDHPNNATDYFYVDTGREGGIAQALPVFGTIALGGTFDRLHNGHRKLLTLGAGLCRDTLVVGITGDAMLQKKSLADKILSYQERAKAVVDFLALIKPSLQVNVFQLTDPFGPTITDSTIEALVVSSETLGGVQKINDLRREKGFSPLAGLVVRRDDISILSSTFIRESVSSV
jgi:cytidyltransferase-like protein